MFLVGFDKLLGNWEALFTQLIYLSDDVIGRLAGAKIGPDAIDFAYNSSSYAGEKNRKRVVGVHD
jgi:hypothetical protein